MVDSAAAALQVSPPVVAAVGASLVAWLEGEEDAACAAAGVAAALRFVGEPAST